MTEERALTAAPAREPDPSTGESIVDFTALNERRAYLGNLAEELALEGEQKRLRSAGRADLATNVRIVSSDHRLGYDIASFEEDGSSRPIEVKAANRRGGAVDFFLTENERGQATEVPNYWLYLVFQPESTRPDIRCIPANALPAESLRPVVYRASVLLS